MWNRWGSLIAYGSDFHALNREKSETAKKIISAFVEVFF